MWDKWITDNYPFLSGWAKTWARDRSDELLSYFCIWLEKNWERKFPKDEEERKAFTNYWLKQNASWNNSEFNKIDRKYSSGEEIEFPEEDYTDYSEIYAEEANVEVLDWLRDITQNWGEKSNKLIALRSIYLSLSLEDRVVWDLYFEKMMSLRKMAVKLNIPMSACHKLVNDLKYKIKNKYNGLDN